MPDWNGIACRAYETYAQIVRADAQLLPVPEWEDLPPRHHDAWREAVKTVAEYLGAEATKG